MASTTVYSAIKAHLQATFAPMPVVDFDDIEPTIEQTNANFLCLEEVVGAEDEIGFGDPANLCFREDSTLLVHAFVPAPESSGVARQLAEQVQSALRLQILNGVKVDNVGPPEPDAQNDGLWTSASVAVSVIYDFKAATP